MDEHKLRYWKMYPLGLMYCLLLFLLSALLDSTENILNGMKVILFTNDTLITDYFASAGVGAALFNSAIIVATTLFTLWVARDPLNGFTIAVLGLMSGFALFGKNLLNSLPILLGGWLYARYQKHDFQRYVNATLLSTCLGPIVSFICFSGGGIWSFLTGMLVGVLIGFVLPSLSSYTFKLQNGMNLYNMGFACGLFGMIVVAILSSLKRTPQSALFWATGYNLPFAILLSLLCVFFIVAGLFFCKRPPWAAWAGYRELLKSSGRAPSDYLRAYGSSATLINMGVNGLIATGYILLIGGDLNGCTIGGILTIIGFSGYGKHARNIAPILVGMTLGGLVMDWHLTDPASQIACLFCTTLAPISGYFGWQYGILAGFLHSCLVLKTGGPVHGLNLYNNGFSGGIIAIVLYPTLTAIARHRKAVLQDEDYFDIAEGDTPTPPPDLNDPQEPEGAD